MDEKGGYRGKSMSNRAARAYNRGEMPISKWTKKVLLEELAEVAFVRKNDAVKVNGWRKLPATHWRQGFVADFDGDIDRYIEKMYGIGDKKRNRALMADIERKIAQ